MPGHRRFATVGLPHAIGRTTLAILQVYPSNTAQTNFISYINMLADQHPGGLGVGSSNLPAPTNKIRDLDLRSVPQRSRCGTVADPADCNPK